MSSIVSRNAERNAFALLEFIGTELLCFAIAEQEGATPDSDALRSAAFAASSTGAALMDLGSYFEKQWREQSAAARLEGSTRTHTRRTR
jgi:hypothetical protein